MIKAMQTKVAAQSSNTIWHGQRSHYAVKHAWSSLFGKNGIITEGTFRFQQRVCLNPYHNELCSNHSKAMQQLCSIKHWTISYFHKKQLSQLTAVKRDMLITTKQKKIGSKNSAHGSHDSPHSTHNSIPQNQG